MTTLTFPTYSDKGGINMSEVMYAPYQAFEDAGLDVVGHLEAVLQALNARLFHGLTENAEDNVAHEFLDKYDTPEQKARTPGYTLPAMYCLAYKTYVFLGNSCDLRTEDSYEFCLQRVIAMVRCELDKLINGTLIGNCTEPLPIKRGDTVRIPKGTPYTTTRDDEAHVTKRTYNVKVHHIFNGYYGRTIKNPRISWAGTGGNWCDADMKDIEKVG